MIYLQLFWAFFISNLLGYGGGPASIPFMQKEIVDHYQWLTVKEFGEVLAFGNALPGPIATKLAGFVGYQLGGVLGALIALIATVLPSAIAIVMLYKFSSLFRDSKQVKVMTYAVQPVIAVLLGVLAYQFLLEAWKVSGLVHTILLVIASFISLQMLKIHPAFVIIGSLVYGAFFLS